MTKSLVLTFSFLLLSVSPSFAIDGLKEFKFGMNKSQIAQVCPGKIEIDSMNGSKFDCWQDGKIIAATFLDENGEATKFELNRGMFTLTDYEKLHKGLDKKYTSFSTYTENEYKDYFAGNTDHLSLFYANGQVELKLVRYTPELIFMFIEYHRDASIDTNEINMQDI